jgi:hypothetical protein
VSRQYLRTFVPLYKNGLSAAFTYRRSKTLVSERDFLNAFGSNDSRGYGSGFLAGF